VFVGMALIWAFILFTPIRSVLVLTYNSVTEKVGNWLRKIFRLDQEEKERCSLISLDERYVENARASLHAPANQTRAPSIGDRPKANNLEHAHAVPIQVPPSDRRHDDAKINQADCLRDFLNKTQSLERMGFDDGLPEKVKKLVFMLILPWIGQWLFWAGCLRLAGDL